MKLLNNNIFFQGVIQKLYFVGIKYFMNKYFVEQLWSKNK